MKRRDFGTLRRNYDPTSLVKWCCDCGIEKSLPEFNAATDRYDKLQANCRQCQKAYSATHRLRMKIENPQKLQDAVARAKVWRHTNPIVAALGRYRQGAMKRALSFTLPEELFTDLVTDYCFYCGLTPQPINGIDRVKNSLGYIDGNVVTACKQCNWAKRAMSATEFIEWAMRLGTKAPTLVGLAV